MPPFLQAMLVLHLPLSLSVLIRVPGACIVSYSHFICPPTLNMIIDWSLPQQKLEKSWGCSALYHQVVIQAARESLQAQTDWLHSYLSRNPHNHGFGAVIYNNYVGSSSVFPQS